jgi:hypothetical protein
MAYVDPQYFLKPTTDEKRVVHYYDAQNVTETWDDKGNSISGKLQGNQFNAQCFNLEKVQGYQPVPKQGWKFPDKP